MSDQAPDVETPETAESPQDGTGTEHNWQKRYEDTQSAYTQGQQELSQLRQQLQQYNDPEYQAQLLAQWGYELQGDDEDDDSQFVDPNEALQRELQELKQWRDEFTGQQQQQATIAHIEQAVEQQLDQIDGLTDAQKDWIVSRAIALDPTSEGLPDIRAAHEEFRALIDAEKQSWAKSKRAPHISPVGQAGSHTPKLDTAEAKTDYILEQLAANQ